ncbi:hypothetical protein PQX77_019309 [Marasmius sp. AFHP31]|nr:hypothetical protein PQX77_019309 [Marasmius sp. AFHP31]
MAPHHASQRFELAMLLRGQIFALEELRFELRDLKNATQSFSFIPHPFAPPTSTSQVAFLTREKSPILFESYTSSQLRAIDEIDPPLAMHQATAPTPTTTPRKRHIQPTDRASPTIRRLAEERKQTQDEPQPTVNQHAQPHLGPPVIQTAASSPMAAAHSHDSTSSLGPSVPAVMTAPTHQVPHLPPSGKSVSPGPLGYGQPPSASPTPFGFPAPGGGPYAAGHAYSFPTHAAHIYPGAAAYGGYQYTFGPHPTVPPPPPLSRPTSTSGHPTHPPPQPPLSHVHLTVPVDTNSTPVPELSTAPTAPPASNAALNEDAHASDLGASAASGTDKVAPTSSSGPPAPAPLVSPTNVQGTSSTHEVASKPNCEDNPSDNESISGDDENPAQGPRAISRAGGRPSQKKIDAADKLCQKVIAYLARKCAEEEMEQTLVWDRLCGRIVKMKSAPHEWNEYESYAADPEHRATELGHLDGTDLAWDGIANPTSRQLKEAWRLFKEEHSLEGAKAMMEMWSMMKGIVTTQTQGERKRDFVGVQKQLIDLINWVYNRFNIHIWAILAGGLNRSDQTFSSLCELNASKGFSKVLGVEPNEVGPLYQAHICFQNALKVSNQQFAAMGATRGLKVTGPGIDEEPLVGSLPTTLLPPPRTEASPKKSKKEDVRAIFKACLDECLATLNRSFTMFAKLPWSTLAVECVDVGVQVINYPSNTLYPWQDPSDRSDTTESSAAATAKSSSAKSNSAKSAKSNAAKSSGKKTTNRGIKVLPPGDQARLIEACRPDSNHQLTLVLADPIRLEAGDIPVFVTAPDSNGKVIETLAEDIPGCLAAVKALRHTRERKVKFEEVDLGVPPDQNTGNRPTRARAAKKLKADYGDRGGDSGSEGSELTDIETPRPKTKGKVSRFPTPESVPETPSPTKGRVSTKSALKTVSEALATRKGTSAKKTITAAEFDDGDFQPAPPKTLKRGSEPQPHDGPASKKLKEAEQVSHPTTSRPAAVQGPTPAGMPHPPPPFSGEAERPEQDSNRLSAPPTTAAPAAPHPQPPFHWPAQGPHAHGTHYPYPPAMQGPPHANPIPPHLPFPTQPPSAPMQAPYPQLGGAAPANMPPEMVSMMYNMLMAQLTQAPGYQPPSTGPGNQ